MRNTGLDEAQAGIKIARRNINNLRYADDTTLMAESEEELKSLLRKVKEESEKVGLVFIPKTKIMASGHMTSWQIDGKTVERVADFVFLGAPKSLQMVIAATKLKDAYSLESYDQPRQYIKKQTHYFATKVRLVKAMDFPVVMYGCESLTVKNSIKTCVLSSVKQIASPGWMHETSARGWCSGMTQRDGMGREVGGVFRMGNTCKSMADSCQCMAETTTIF